MQIKNIDHESKRIRKSNEKIIKKRLSYVVIGGGIAGVCCAQELARLHDNESSSSSSCIYDIILISATNVLKESIGVMKISKHLEEFSVFEKKADFFKLDNPNIKCIENIMVTYIDTTKKILYLNNNDIIEYWKLCICTGAIPKLITDHPNVIGIRDLQTVEDLMLRIKEARKIVVVGNGGIALELIHALDFLDIDWFVKDDYIGNTFFDATASEFIMPSLLTRSNISDVNDNNNNLDINNNNLDNNNNNNNNKIDVNDNTKSCGAALGPEWLSKNQHLLQKIKRKSNELRIHFQQEIISIKSRGNKWKNTNDNNEYDDKDDGEWPLYLKSSNGDVLGCDFIISATGVVPATIKGDSIELDQDGAIIVNENMESSAASVYAAGDCCSYKNIRLNTPIDDNTHWFQMRLWSQARSMGIYAAHCMSNMQDNFGSDFFLELFAHVTRFFGFKVVLLGRYNGQGLGIDIENAIKEIIVNPHNDDGTIKVENKKTKKEYKTSHLNDINNNIEIWTRVTVNEEYIKIIIKDGKVIGALLIGDTNLEEVFENLILNQLDVSALGADILNPDIDIEDYFD